MILINYVVLFFAVAKAGFFDDLLKTIKESGKEFEKGFQEVAKHLEPKKVKETIESGLLNLGRGLFYLPAICSEDDVRRVAEGQGAEMINIASTNSRLVGILFNAQAAGKPIVYFHGRTGNVLNNLRIEFARRMSNELGSPVVLVDYSGFGASSRSGSITEDLMIQNGLDIINWTYDRFGRKSFIYSHSLGGAVAIATMHRLNGEKVSGVALDNTFDSVGTALEADGSTLHIARSFPDQWDSMKRISEMDKSKYDFLLLACEFDIFGGKSMKKIRLALEGSKSLYEERRQDNMHCFADADPSRAIELMRSKLV